MSKLWVLPFPIRTISLLRAVWLMALWAACLAGAATSHAADEEKNQPLPPEEVTLKTKDDLDLVATYYPSKLGKKAVPVVLLHASRSNRGELDTLARKLQAAGHAVLVPDLRGHGNSQRPASELRVEDYADMVDKDLEAVKKFLVQRNNAGELNIEKLSVVGIEMGAVLTVLFAANDWSWPPLATGKQGQDVKAVVLVSPEWAYKGLRINEAITQPGMRSDVASLIIVGKGNAKQLAEARRLHTALERHHLGTVGQDGKANHAVELKAAGTSLQGTRLVNEKSMRVDDLVLKFIDAQVGQRSIAWAERRSAVE
jgi:pimeloyl-ACP methyl ester carboxylesterase